MTPYQLNLMAQNYNECKKEQENEKITLAYLTAKLQRIEKMPSLNKLLGKEEPKKVMTQEEMLDQVKILNEAFGGTTY
jgi:hypothetical protein